MKYLNFVLNTKYICSRRTEKRGELLENLGDLTRNAQSILAHRNLLYKLYQQNFKNSTKLAEFFVENHLSVKEKLLKNHESTIQILRSDYISRLELIKTDFAHEKQIIDENYDRSLAEIQHFIDHLEASYSEEINEERGLYAKKVSSIRFDHQNELAKLRQTMNAKIKCLKDSYDELNKVISSDEARFAKPDCIKEKNLQLENEIKQNYTRVKFLKEKVRLCEEKLNLTNFEHLLVIKRNALHEKYKEYHESMKTVKKCHVDLNAKLKTLVIVSTKALDKLRSSTSKCEKIMKLIEICKRLETPEERRKPFCAEKSDNLSKKLVDVLNESEFGFIFCDKFATRFQYRMTRVNFEIESLKLTKRDLLKDEENLKKNLKNYFESL